MEVESETMTISKNTKLVNKQQTYFNVKTHDNA